MTLLGWAILALLGLTLLGFASRKLLDNPREDVETGLLFLIGRTYVRLVHHLRVEGLEHVPAGRTPGPLVVVSNHTAGVDPVLVQANCPFEIRWLMAEDMRLPGAEWFWTWAGIISVKRTSSSEVQGLRSALRVLASGGVIGIFPEGGLERPTRHVLPFSPGVGLLVKKSRARVLPVVVDDTPQTDPAWSSLWQSSRASVRYMAPIDYTNSEMSGTEIAEDLRERYLKWTGWPRNDHPVEPDPTHPGQK